MLGIWSNPTGNDKKHLEEVVLKKYRTWIDRSKNGHLSARLNWESYYFKLWAGLNYGLATLATPTNMVQQILDRLDYEALPLLGVSRSLKKEWRVLPRACGGIGLRNLVHEQFIGWINMLLQHYGSSTTLGLKCAASLEALQLELGCRGNPLLENYAERGILSTSCWITAIWERIHRYKFPIHLKYPTLQNQRKNDEFLVDIFLREGYRGMELRRLNRCRLHLKAIFLSDITTANGRRLEDFAFQGRIGRESIFRFPRELPSNKDWRAWDDFWTGWRLPNGTLHTPLGHWEQKSHQVWRWYFNESNNTIWESDPSEVWVGYRKIATERGTRSNARYQTFCTMTNVTNPGKPASVRTADGTVVLLDTGPDTFRPTTQNYGSFWEFVHRQGGGLDVGIH